MSDWPAPDVIASAPGRVNLIGEHIDFSQGLVLPFAIADRTFARIRKREDRDIRIRSAQRPNHLISTSLDQLLPRSDGDWERYVLGVIWALNIHSGVDIEIDGHVPLGAGLSSSAALECAVALALNELFSCGFSRKELALMAQKAENDFVGVPCGIMDQSVSLMAQSGSALLLDCRDLETRLLPFDLGASGLQLLIIDTQVQHALVDGGYAQRRQSCESVVAKLEIASLRDLSLMELEDSKGLITAEEYKRAHHAVTEIERVLSAVDALVNKDFTTLGQLMNASHQSLRDDYEVSCPELNCAVDTAILHSAIGARMVGGGFGGSAIALADQVKIGEIEDAIKVAFASTGFHAPRFFTSLPSDGARIEPLA
jgi:galactokinase